MPLDGPPLTEAQIAAVKTWIDEGAHWDAAPVASSAPARSVNAGPALEHSPLPPGARDYWAFKLPVQAPLPMAAAHWTNPIDRFLEKTRASKGLAGGTARGSPHARAPGVPRPDWPAADARSDGGVPRRHGAGLVGTVDRHAARLAALRRAMGPSLAGCRPLRRYQRLRGRPRPAQHLALSRLCHPLTQQRQALQRVPHRTGGGR